MLKKLCLTATLAFGLLCGCASSLEDKAQGSVSTNVSTNEEEKTISTHLLDGTVINWTYNSSNSGMLLSFGNGVAQYEWITGPRKGNSDQDIPYNSREIGDEMYLINWVQPQKPDFITLIFDFKNKTVFSSGLIGYGTDRQKNLFMAGTINSVED